MWRKTLACILVFTLLATFASAQSNLWSTLKKIHHGEKIEVLQMNLKTVKGEFASSDETSISLLKKGKLITCNREDVLSVSLQGPSKRKRNVLTGLAVGAGAGLALGLLTTSNDDGWEIVSDEAVTAATGAMGAGVGALVGAASPAHDYRNIYRAPGKRGDKSIKTKCD